MLDNEKIARMVTIDFFSMVDEEDPEAPSLSLIEVIEATDSSIKFQMTYINPSAVSRNPVDADEIQMSFDKKYFSDPETDIEINSGQTLIIKLPRQIDPA